MTAKLSFGSGARSQVQTWERGEQVRFKFSKACGEIDGINLYGRKSGETALLSLGRFNATPGNVNVPLANGNPEEWQFEARAVKRDKEIGLASPAVTVIVRS